IGARDADARSAGDAEVHVGEKLLVIVALRESESGDDFTRVCDGGFEGDFEDFLFSWGFGHQLAVSDRALEARAAVFGFLTALPSQMAGDEVLFFGDEVLILDVLSLGGEEVDRAGVVIGRVVADEALHAGAVYLDDALGDTVEQVAVVRDD